jgi:SDR family mycofactocin-dependent oxidoreductase
MARLAGKVAFVTGAARGQGRSHAVRLAQEGASVIAVDICGQIDSVGYPMSTAADLDETVKMVEAEDSRIVARQADVRERDAMAAVLEEGIAELGELDIVVANAGIMPLVGDVAYSQAAWLDSVDVLLTGVFNTIDLSLPSLRKRGIGGSIVITSSAAGLRGPIKSMQGMSPGYAGYTAAKHGVVGLMRLFANALGGENIRVNTVHPTGVNSPMVVNDEFAAFVEKFPEITASMANALPIPLIEPVDVSNAIIWLCSDEARYVTGVTLPVDAGCTNR